MRRTLIHGAAIALLTSTVLASEAMAQDAPPVSHNIDANGVDVVLGSFNMRQRLLSIGPNGQEGFEYVRMLNEGMWLDNATGGVFQSGNEVSVSIGDTSATFTFSGGLNLFNSGTYTPKRADGSTLTRSGGTFSYTNAAGVVMRTTAAIGSNGHIVAGSGRLVDLHYPNGMLVTFAYRTENVCDEFGGNCATFARLQSVNSSANYQLHFTYSQDTIASGEDYPAWHALTAVQAINTAVESCSSSADHCTLTGSWPLVAFGTSGSDETVTLPDGNVWRLTPGTGGPSAIRRPGSTSDDVSISYDAGARVTSVTGLAGTWTYSYSDSGNTRTTTVSGPVSGARTVVSDLVHETIASDTDALSHTTSYQYDSSDRRTRITAPEGNYVSYTYDGRGNVTQTQFVPKSGSGTATLTLTASFPSSCTNALTCNHPTSVTDARGNTTDYTYDSSHGGVLTITRPAPTTGATRPQVRYSYTQVTAVSGQPVYLLTGASACRSSSSCAGGSDETKSTISYGTSNLLPTSIATGDGSGSLTTTNALTYDDIGNLLTMDGPLSGTTDTARFRYNAMRQVVGVIGPDPDGGGSLHNRAVRTSFDAAGLPSAIEVGTVNSQSDSDWSSMSVLQGMSVERDGLGRPLVQRLVSGGTTYALTQISYDGRGRVQCVARRMNSSEFATASLPTDACTLDTTGGYGSDRVARTTYDAADHVTLAQTGYGVSGVQADEAASSYTNNGRLATVTDAEGNMTTYEYDGQDRLVKTRFPSPTTDNTSSTTDYEQLTLDANGNVTSLRRRDGNSIDMTYDTLDRPTARDLPGSELDVSYAYDLMGGLTSAATSAQTLSFTYDALGRNLTQVSPLGTVSYGYDAAGRRTSMTYPGSTTLVIGYTYDAANDLTEVRENPSSSNILLAAYVFDDRGRRTALNRYNGTGATYGYDSVSRLTQLVENLSGTSYDQTLDFSFNPAGQIVSATRSNDSYAWANHYAINRGYTANGLNQYSAVGAITPTYDSRGNVTSAGSVTYSYSSENLLTGASGGVTLTYDPRQRLYQTSGASTTRMLYDGVNLIAEYDGSNNLLRRYVHGPRADEPLVWYEGTGLSDRRFLHADERGSIVATSNGSGAMLSVNTYDEFGIPGSSNSGRFQYTGQQWLGEIGMYYYRARIYSPTLGRFLQSDPIGYSAGMNFYAYVRNDAINLVDPMGLQEIVVTGHPPPTPDNGEPMDLGGNLGLGFGRMVMRGPTVSENPPAEIIVTGTRPPKPQPAADQADEADDGESEQVIVVTGIPLLRQASIFGVFRPFGRFGRFGDIFDFFSARPPIMRFPWPRNQLEPPGPGWEWRGQGTPEEGRGAWYNKDTGQSLHPDLHHPPGIRPHWDYRGPEGDWRWFEDGTWEQKLVA